jgi:hypothetical protein
VITVTTPTPEPNPVAAPGNPVLERIATAQADLEGIELVPLAEAAGRFEVLHAELQSALADLDQH